jgi:alkylation response protein AidB-like acyl-CoA dehydrogenase
MGMRGNQSGPVEIKDLVVAARHLLDAPSRPVDTSGDA